MFTLIALETTTRDARELINVDLANVVFCGFFLVEWCLGLVLARDRYEHFHRARQPL